MTQEQKAAFINAQSVMAQIELQGMIAENRQREILGHSMAYVEGDFAKLYQNYNSTIGHNAILELYYHD